MNVGESELDQRGLAYRADADDVRELRLELPEPMSGHCCLNVTFARKVSIGGCLGDAYLACNRTKREALAGLEHHYASFNECFAQIAVVVCGVLI